MKELWWANPEIDIDPPDLIGSIPFWCVASNSPDFYQIFPIYHETLKTRIFCDLSVTTVKKSTKNVCEKNKDLIE